MKLIRYGKPKKEKPGILTSDGRRLDVSAFGEDFGEQFFEKNGLQRLAHWLKKNEQKCHTVSPKIRLGAPLMRPSKLVCIGLNYARHAAESGMVAPTEPVVFF